MRILYLLDFYALEEDIDGRSKIFYNIFKHTSDKIEADILFVNVDKRIVPEKFFNVKNIYFENSKAGAIQQVYQKGIFKPGALPQREILKLAKKYSFGSYDIVHASRFSFFNFKDIHPRFLLGVADSDSDNFHNDESIRRKLRFIYWKIVEYRLSRMNYWMSFVSERDAKAYKNSNKSFVMHNGVDFFKYKPLQYEAEKVLNSFVFHGVLDYQPNIDAIFYMSETLRFISPEIKLHLVGRVNRRSMSEMERIFKELENCELVGPVDDISKEISKYQFYIVLMKSGSGIKNKLIEALSTGCIVFANERAINGLVKTEELLECIYLVNSPKDIEIGLADGKNWRTKSEKAITYIKKYYSWELYGERLLSVYNSILTSGL